MVKCTAYQHGASDQCATTSSRMAMTPLTVSLRAIMRARIATAAWRLMAVGRPCTTQPYLFMC